MAMELETLLQQPESRRDDQWEKKFLELITQAKVQIVEEQAKPGPDGWPYLLLRTGAESTEPFLNVLDWCARRGIGIALNTHKMLPDYIFTFGMLWNYALNRQFVSFVKPPSPGEVKLNAGEEKLIGAPTEEYLPSFVRQVLRDFFAAQGITAPRIAVISNKDYSEVDLVFSAASLNNLKPQDFRSMSEALSWFLPLHYSIVMSSEDQLRGFVDL